jgi:hypothetical protein
VPKEIVFSLQASTYVQRIFPCEGVIAHSLPVYSSVQKKFLNPLAAPLGVARRKVLLLKKEMHSFKVKAVQDPVSSTASSTIHSPACSSLPWSLTDGHKHLTIPCWPDC